MATSEQPVPRLLDGGFSTQLIFHLNMSERECNNHPLWCARFLKENPSAVVHTHADYIRAGADIIITNSYQASVDGFRQYLNLTESESLDLIRTSVRLAKKAIKLVESEKEIDGDKLNKKIYIAGSVGSYGACLHDGSEYNGASYINNVSREMLKEWHRPRICALTNEGVDFLAIETIPALMEAEVIQELLNEFPDQKFWISFTCKDERHTVFGDHIGDAAKSLWLKNTGQLTAVGVNCLNPIFVTPLTNMISKACGGLDKIPTIAYPNTSEKWDENTKQWVPVKGFPPLKEFFIDWVKSGISIIGGCCRTTAEDIKVFRQYLDTQQEPQQQPQREHQ